MVLTSASVWPNTLVLCALYNTLHSATYSGIGTRDGMSRERFFAYAFVAATVWCKLSLRCLCARTLSEFLDIFPGYLFTALRYEDALLSH